MVPYYIFDIKEGEDELHGNILILRAGIVEDNRVSELPCDWDMFFFRNTPQMAHDLVALAKVNDGRWNVNFSDFRESRIDFEGVSRYVYYHKSLPKKKFSIWTRLFHRKSKF